MIQSIGDSPVLSRSHRVHPEHLDGRGACESLRLQSVVVLLQLRLWRSSSEITPNASNLARSLLTFAVHASKSSSTSIDSKLQENCHEIASYSSKSNHPACCNCHSTNMGPRDANEIQSCGHAESFS